MVALKIGNNCGERITVKNHKNQFLVSCQAEGSEKIHSTKDTRVRPNPIESQCNTIFLGVSGH